MPAKPITLSICLVGINARDYLKACLECIRASHFKEAPQVIYVDNGSTDDSLAMLSAEFPEVQQIRNDHNTGYTFPNNQAIRQSQGEYVLLLNADTVFPPETLPGLLEFMQTHPEVGVCGPKLLNRDGSFQLHCKRGEARPLEVIAYFSGLSRMFPQNPVLGGYLQTHLDENVTQPVPAISGACMLIRRKVIDVIGGLDEDYFAYQEDTDFCVRARKAGWKVFYVPTVQMTHFGGQSGSRVQPFHAIYTWHRSYFIYYRKHLARDYFFLFNWFYYGLMAGKLLLALLTNLVRKERFPGPRRG
jgi:GT2 family glycosyltransferase